jgi:VanZ family protein
VRTAPTDDSTSGWGSPDPSWRSRWVPVVLWASTIWTFSTGWFDGAGTGGFLLPILGALFPYLEPEVLDRIHGGLRKLAHLAEFAILAPLLARALARPQRSSFALGCWTLGGCLMWAALDEYHQSFVPTRVGAPQDVLLDTLGAGLGFLVYRWIRFSSDRQLRA